MKEFNLDNPSNRGAEMKRTPLVIGLLVSLFLIINNNKLYSQGYDLDIELSAEKTDFEYFEPIFLTLRIVNHSKNGPHLIGRGNFEEELSIKDNEGNIYRNVMFTEYMGLERMKLNQEIIYELSIMRRFCHRDSAMLSLTGKEESIGGYDFLPGQYEIQFAIFLDGMYLSNMVVVKVNDVRTQNILAFSYFKKGLYYFRRNNVEAKTYFWQVVNQYPESPYTKDALYFLQYIYDWSDESETKYDNLLKIGNKYFNDFNELEENYYGIALRTYRVYYEHKNDLKEFDTKLDSLKDLSKNNNPKFLRIYNKFKEALK